MKKYINILSGNLNNLLTALLIFMVILTDNICEYDYLNLSVLMKDCSVGIIISLCFYALFELPRKQKF